MFQVFLLFVLKCLLASHLTVFRFFTLLWLGSCTHCILVCFLWSKKPKHSSSNHGLCCFNPLNAELNPICHLLALLGVHHFFHVSRIRVNSCRPGLFLAEVLIFSLMFSQAPVYAFAITEVLKSCKPVLISIWYCFLTSSSFSFLRLFFSHPPSLLLVYLLPDFL